ncbi:Ig-like domain-containing protein [Rhizobium sp. C1]|uniref:Ig-like domain-containing protein n=1 Tax=Rhizobium sp. C1 TaxID=1349799 RepID=UPI001E3CE5FF|nr:Ig-like domain-containing protein [Rhizobium sp. C1]MCD2177596.1 Ig-like domain-containing protein [Rhizobium sp. C1]
MQNNRAIWLAILVLVIASAVMIFFVLPQVNGGKNVAGDGTKPLTDSASSAPGTAPQTASKASGPASGAELLQKMNRLKADASAASESLRALYANGKVPTDAQLADAKTKLQAALQAIADFKAPDGADAAVGGLVTGLSASAGKALSALKSMPEDAGRAADAASQIAALFSDKTARNGQMQAAPAAPAAAAPDAVEANLPTFDVLRVEKDGSTVIAGAASPKAKIEVMDGDKVIGTATAGQSGDFAIALDKPLEPGDHSLVLKATGADGKSVVSAEVATVAVPNGSEGKLLAMVTKPGEASRILTKPEGGTQVADAHTSAGAAPAAVPPLPDASKTAANTAPAVPATPSASTDSVNAPAETAAIRIDAVEIEGDKIFVAGSTRPQAVVQVYADDKLIETTKSSASGHFEAENTMPLTTGNHIIRADLMDQSGSKVVVRASVPFNRPAGDQVSVVADTAKPATAKGANAAAQSGLGQLEQLREEAAKAIVLLKGLFADGKTPAKDQLAAARSATQIALKALADFRPAADAGPNAAALSAKVARSAADALKLLQAAGDDPKSVGGAIASIEAAARDAMPDVAKPALAAPPAPATSSAAPLAAAPAADQQAANAEASSAAGNAPKSIEQAPLKESKDSVIIRKGDTLWQISRRVYGRGIRYTTIYLANQDMIDNPNRIAPGQVFGVPGKVTQSDEDAEKANRELRKKH